MRLILISMLLLLCAPAAWPALPLVLDQQTEKGLLLSQENIDYQQLDREVDWASVLTLPAETWRRPRGATVGETAPNQAHWLRVRLRNGYPHARDFRLELRWPLLHDAQVRILRQGEFGPVNGFGTHQRTAGTPYSNKMRVPLHLGAQEEVDVYFRVIDNAMLYMPMVLWSAEAYEAQAQQKPVITSFVFGVLAVMLLYNAILVIFTRDWMYLFYCNTVLGTILFLLSVSGYGQQLLWGEIDWLVDNAYPLFSSYTFLAVTVFFRVFVQLKQVGGWPRRLNDALIALWLIVLVALIAGFWRFAGILTVLGGLAGTVVGLVVSIHLWRKGNRAAKFFLLSWSPVSASTVYLILTILSITPYHPIIDYSQLFSFAIEMVFLAVALAERIQRERRAREEAQALALRRQQDILDIQERATAELEATVSSRTQELQTALEALSRANTDLAQLSETDSLTKLGNRRHFDNAVEMEVLRAIRNETPLCLMLLDIDRFKAVNDTYGHLVGDRCLQHVAEIIGKVVERDTDVVVRYGGEEFAAILPNTASDAARKLAERLRSEVETKPLFHQGRSIALSISIGYVSCQMKPGFAPSQLIELADRALYDAKQRGRNCVVAAAAGDVDALELSGGEHLAGLET